MITTGCLLFSFLVEAIVLWQYTVTLFLPKGQTKTRLFLLCFSYFSLFVLSLFDIKWLNAFVYLLVNFLFLLSQYQLKWHSAMFHSAVLTAVMSMCELTVFSVMEHFVPHFFSQASSFHNIILFAIFSKLIFFTVIYTLMHVLKKSQEYSRKHEQHSPLLVFIPLISVYIMLIFVAVHDSCVLSSMLSFMITVGAVLLLVTNLFVFGIDLRNQKKNLEFTEMQLLLQKEAATAEYYKMLLSQNENQSILIHDIKKHLQSIHALNSKKEHNKLSAYIERLLDSSDLKESARLCDHELLNTILCRYQRQCKENQILFHTDIRHGTIDFIADSDLTSLFCNLLDNAVEAACRNPEAFIEINSSKRSNAPWIVISVINSSRQDPFLNSNGMLISNKPNKRKHGFGLKSIRKTVSKYHGEIKMYFHKDTMTFHTIIFLKQPEESAD